MVKQYIGVPDGHLGDFSFSTLRDFYPEFCDLSFDIRQSDGTKRYHFERILRTVPPVDQAKIVRGTLKKYPPDTVGRSQAMYDEFLQIALRLEGAAGVGSHRPAITSEVVDRAIADTEHLIRTTGATSGVDRVHTMLHGYMKAVCDGRGICYTGDPTILSLFKLTREQHPALTPTGPRAQDITQILRTLGSIMDVLNPIRNGASMAHPAALLEPPEAMLVVNAARTILHYIDTKLGS